MRVLNRHVVEEKIVKIHCMLETWFGIECEDDLDES